MRAGYRAVFDLALDARSLKIPSGRVEFGLKDGGIALTDFRYTRGAIGTAHLARLAAIRRAIVAGDITPPATREALAAFKPVPLP